MNILKRGLIVSCQAIEGNPFRDSKALALMAKSAEIGGAVAIRANGYDDISEMKKNISIPILVLNKLKYETGRTVITPNFEAAKVVAEAGSDVIALDVTFEKSNIREEPKELIYRIKNELKLPVLADISTLEEAIYAQECGADYISTTLSGYMPSRKHADDELYIPDLQLIKDICDNEKCTIPVIAEGRYWTPEDIQKALDLGAYGIVIGKAITNPIAITRYMISGINF